MSSLEAFSCLLLAVLMLAFLVVLKYFKPLRREGGNAKHGNYFETRAGLRGLREPQAYQFFMNIQHVNIQDTSLMASDYGL